VAFCWAPEEAAGTSASAGEFSNGTGLIQFLVYANKALRQTCALALGEVPNDLTVTASDRGAPLCDNEGTDTFVPASFLRETY
jgi:hypothetical protein